MSGMSKMKEAALAEYLDECTEMVERFSQNLSAIEAGNMGKDTLGAIYRDMHTIKGTSQLFGYSQVGQLAHAMETCLDPVRKGKAKVLPLLVDSLYAGIDVISTLLRGIRETKQEPDMSLEVTRLVPKLVSACELSLTGTLPPTQEKVPVVDAVHKGSDSRHTALAPSESSKIPITEDHKPVSNDNKPESSFPGFAIFDDDPIVAPTPPPATLIQDKKEGPGVSTKTTLDSSSRASADDQHSETIRVHVSLLDSLMNLVGELVLIRNQLLQHAKNNDDDDEFGKVSQRLNVLTAELQNEVMKTRMQPIGNILNKFSRVVRDMGRDLGKKIELELEGAETELDKTILEAVKDPLTHIVRNAVDHGIEMPAERKAAGKPETGHIRLKSYHESGQVIIEIVDDGRGLNRQVIGNKAVEKGLITADALSKMTDREVQFLIFAPGFSTASTISNISGRGVGMDVVRTNVERIGGMVDLLSTPSAGSTIKIKIPLTLAIVPALIVRAENQRFAIPQTKLVELLRIDESDGNGERIEALQGRPVLRLRGRLLPLVRLAEVLAGTDFSKSSTTSTFARAAGESSVLNIVVLNADNFLFGLIVDEIEDSADIVVKSLAQFLKDLNLFSGATIMGDGAVALTVDVMGISSTAHLFPDDMEALHSTKAVDLHKGNRDVVESAEFLLIDVGAPNSYAIPLTLVSRLEEFEVGRFELSGEQKVIRYRDSLLPIFSLPEFLHLPFEKNKIDRERMAIVVIRRGERLYGIEVNEIQDVVSIAGQIDQSVKDRPGILGSVIAQDKVIVVVDILGMIDAQKSRIDVDLGVATEQVQTYGAASVSARRRQHRILIVEDSAFFRNYIRQVVADAGFMTEICCDGVEGLAALENAHPNHYSLVLSDIEMPNMDGLELARSVRKLPQFAQLPMVAITTRFSSSEITTGHEAGFNSYMEKLNAEKLLAELDSILCHQEKELKRATNG